MERVRDFNLPACRRAQTSPQLAVNAARAVGFSRCHESSDSGQVTEQACICWRALESIGIFFRDESGGEVTALNQEAIDDPSIIAADPYGAGWLFEVQATAAGNLLTADEYAELNEES